MGSHGTEPQPGAFSLKASFPFSIHSRSSALPGVKPKSKRRTIDRIEKKSENEGEKIHFDR